MGGDGGNGGVVQRGAHALSLLGDALTSFKLAAKCSI